MERVFVLGCFEQNNRANPVWKLLMEFYLIIKILKGDMLKKILRKHSFQKMEKLILNFTSKVWGINYQNMKK